MERRPFSEVLKSAKIDLDREYERLFRIFNIKDRDGYSLRDICKNHFLKVPFRGTILSLEEFDTVHNFKFEMPPKDFDINYLVNYCEYIYNFIVNLQGEICFYQSNIPDPIQHIYQVIEKIGYMQIHSDGFTLFVPKSQPAIVVSEMLPKDLSYKVIEYNHHSMKCDLKRKQITLKLLADLLEGKRDALHNANSKLESNIFSLVNNLNIRHNNIDPSSDKYKKAVADMSEEELEQWYDEIYEMILLAFMELDHAERKEKIAELQQKFNPKK